MGKTTEREDTMMNVFEILRNMPWYEKWLIHIMIGAVMASIYLEKDTLKEMWDVLCGRDY